MNRILCLRLLNWPAQRLQRQLSAESRAAVAVHTPVAQPNPRQKAGGARPAAEGVDLRFVRTLFPSAKSGPTVIGASSAAWQAGVRPGMPLAEARSMASPITASDRPAAPSKTAEVTFIEWKPEEDRRELMRMAEIVRPFAPIVGLDDMPVPDSLLLDVTGCGPLFGGESLLAEQLLYRMGGHGLECRLAISDSVAASWACCHPRGHILQASEFAEQSRNRHRSAAWPGAAAHNTPVVIIPPGQAETLLNSFPIATARIPPTDAVLLSQLGICHVKQMLSLPPDDLPARLSPTAVLRIRQLRGFDKERIAGIPEANPVAASWVSEFPATNRNEVRQVLEHLVAEIADQLQRRLLGTIRLDCRLTPENGPPLQLTAELVKAVQSADELSEVLKLRWESLPYVQPIVSVGITAVVAPLPVRRQKDLFSTDQHAKPAEELATTINRLSNRLGRDAVLTVAASENPVPEESVRLTPVMDAGTDSVSADRRIDDLVHSETGHSSTSSSASRPLYLLLEPARIADPGQDLLRDGFVWNGVAHRAAQVVGPERIQTRWWQETAVHRDYYRVNTTAGSQLWIYRDLHRGAWWLHGVFD